MPLSLGQLAGLVAVGVAVLALATVVALRSAEPPARHAQRWSPLFPWLGTGLVVALLVRGATAGAAVVAVATLAHALGARWRHVRGVRRSREER